VVVQVRYELDDPLGTNAVGQFFYRLRSRAGKQYQYIHSRSSIARSTVMRDLMIKKSIAVISTILAAAATIRPQPLP